MQKSLTTTMAKWSALALLLIITILLFSRTAGYGFINYDDPYVVLYNSHLNTGFTTDNIKWAFTSNDMLQWVPVTWLTHMLDFQLYGNKAMGHHVSNVIYHLLNTILLLCFLYKATGTYWRSLFVAALFALHPLHVEPVAWITARKDLVSTFFLLATLLLYLRYVKRPGRVRYILTLVAYFVSLMSKPMYVTIPFMLLVLDFWPLGRISLGPQGSTHSELRRLILEKIPFCLLTVVFSVIAYLAQTKADAITPFTSGLLATRSATIVLSYGEYLFKTFWPATLAIVYPFESPILLPKVLLSGVTLVFCSWFAVQQAWRGRGYLLAGWLWFLVTLIPVIGLVQIGPAFISDKFTYVPLIGLFIMLAWMVPDLWPRLPSRSFMLALCAVTFLSLLTARSWRYVGCWKDSKNLYLEALRGTRNNFMVLSNLAAEYEQEGNDDEALRYYWQSVQAEPRFEVGYASIGYIYIKRGDYHDALPYFQTALRVKPGYPKAMAGLYACVNSLATRK